MALEFTKLVNGKELDVVQEQIEVLDGRVTTNETDIADIKTQLEGMGSGGGGATLSSQEFTNFTACFNFILEKYKAGKLYDAIITMPSNRVINLTTSYHNYTDNTEVKGSKSVSLYNTYILTPATYNDYNCIFSTYIGTDPARVTIASSNISLWICTSDYDRTANRFMQAFLFDTQFNSMITNVTVRYFE